MSLFDVLIWYGIPANGGIANIPSCGFSTDDDPAPKHSTREFLDAGTAGHTYFELIVVGI